MSEKKANYPELVQCLEDLIKVYRHLLQVVRKEREILVSANLDDLNENNRSKEAMLMKIKQHEATRQNIVAELANEWGMPLDPMPRLADFARRLSTADSERLLRIQSTLELLFKRVQELNQENEVLVKSALENIAGAIDSIRGTLQNKRTYQQQGKLAGDKATTAGHLISKEA